MKQEKTILEWLNQLPEPYKSQAIENTKNDDPFSGNEIVDSLWKAIDGGFLWSSTPQGSDYWFEITARAANGEFNTPDDTIPWPPESDWSNAPDNTFARAVDSDGACYHFMLTPASRLYEHPTWVESRRPCGKIHDMTNIDWKNTLQFRPK